MQQLSVELKNTPRDVQSVPKVQTLLVPCSVSSELNREGDENQDLSVQNIVLADNNLEGVLPQTQRGKT